MLWIINKEGTLSGLLSRKKHYSAERSYHCVNNKKRDLRHLFFHGNFPFCFSFTITNLMFFSNHKKSRLVSFFLFFLKRLDFLSLVLLIWVSVSPDSILKFVITQTILFPSTRNILKDQEQSEVSLNFILRSCKFFSFQFCWSSYFVVSVSRPCVKKQIYIRWQT